MLPGACKSLDRVDDSNLAQLRCLGDPDGVSGSEGGEDEPSSLSSMEFRNALRGSVLAMFRGTSYGAARVFNGVLNGACGLGAAESV